MLLNIISLTLVLGTLIQGSVAQNFTLINIPLPGTTEYQLEYFIAGNNITFVCRAKTEGWVGLGLSNSSGMADADMGIGGRFPNGTYYFNDYHTVGQTVPVVDSHTDWELIDHLWEANQTAVAIRRPLVTGDPQDVSVEDKEQVIIWAFGSSDDFEYHGSGQRGTVSFNLIQAQPASTTTPPPSTTPNTSGAISLTRQSTVLLLFVCAMTVIQMYKFE